MVTNFRFKTATLTTCGARDIFANLDILKNKDVVYNLLEDTDLPPYDKRFLDGKYGKAMVRYFPIMDYGVPESMAKYNAVIEDITKTIKSGKNVLVHCYGGTGRTGLIIVGFFTRIMGSATEAYELVSKRRKALETPAQRKYIQTYEDWLRQNYLIPPKNNRGN